ncbi:MAG: hypothetical protein N4A45_04735 [Flavobacteriales bacterium]|nr:hypothetical protein [Flavobacteriales bacterium]
MRTRYYLQNSRKQLLLLFFLFASLGAQAQKDHPSDIEKGAKLKNRVSLPFIIVPQFFSKSWEDRTNTQHIELHYKREISKKATLGVKFATWQLFQPMGITWWDGLLDKIETKSEFYPGHLRERGLGITYQRTIWKDLFVTVEVLPLFKTYLDMDRKKIGNGFKLYNSFHLGYHFSFGKNKQFFIEPQVHSQFWVFDTKTPESFKVLDDKWRNYFLFEPNIYIGVKI